MWLLWKGSRKIGAWLSESESVSHSVMSNSTTPRMVAHPAPLSMGFSRQGYWSGLPFPAPGDLSHPRIEPWTPALLQILYCLSHKGSPNKGGRTFMIEHCAQSVSRVRLHATPRTVARQAPLSLGFSRHGYWGGLLCPSPEDLPDPGKPRSPALQADSLLSEPPGTHDRILGSLLEANWPALFTVVGNEPIDFFCMKCWMVRLLRWTVALDWVLSFLLTFFSILQRF